MGSALYLGDCAAIMLGLARKSVSAVITDPPYGIGYASSWTTRLNGESRTARASFGKDEFSDAWVDWAADLCVPHAPWYVFTRWDMCAQLKESLEKAALHVVQRLVWDKKHWKMGDLRYYGSQLEDILFCRKGTPTMQYQKRTGNLFSYSSSYMPEGQYDHPTQKPEALLRRFIVDSTRPGDTVLDPYMGSGSTGVACAQTGRSFIGIEIDPYFFEIAEKRIAEAEMQSVMEI